MVAASSSVPILLLIIGASREFKDTNVGTLAFNVIGSLIAALLLHIISRLRRTMLGRTPRDLTKPPVEGLKPEPPPVSADPFFAELVQIAGITPEGEIAWIAVPRWKAVLWTLVVFCTGTYAMFATTIRHPPESSDWIWLAEQWRARIVLLVSLLVAWYVVPRFAGFLEDKIIIEHFPQLCLPIRLLLVWPRFMALCVMMLALLWAYFVVVWYFLVNNRPPIVTIIIGVAALIGLVLVTEAYKDFSVARAACSLCLFVVWFVAVTIPAILFFKLSHPSQIVYFLVLVIGFCLLDDRLTAWTLVDSRRFAGVIVIALLAAVTLGLIVCYSAPTQANDAKSTDLEKRGNEARRNGDYPSAIYLLKRAVDANPTNNMAWNALGLAYLDSRQEADAIKAFQRQIEIDPHHPFAYNNLGRVYLQQRNYPEAMKWFNKQLEIDPLDKDAHANVGLAYLEQEKYVEAVPELERAASLTPDNAEAQVRLGEAYLNVGRNEKAMTAFDNALKISTRPVVWNNIAYQLARKRVHLDVARRYADSAVTSTAAALRTLSLDQLTSRDLGLTASLANFWDTLGWVNYAAGNLAVARKYTEAAWQMNQHSEVGDHLGQIFEKEGEKEKALHQYTLAMNARRPDAALRNRLNTLAGGGERADALIAKTMGNLLQQRTISVRNTAKQEGNGDFFILLAKGSGLTASIDSVKFISGDEKLKGLAETLRSVPYSVALPDETPVRLLLRGTLSCAAATADCSFVLLPPDDLRSVD